MGSKAIALIRSNHAAIIIWVVLFKIILAGLEPAEAFCVFVLLLSVQGAKVVDYLFPKRPDLYTDISVLKNQINDLTIKNEELERDVTGLKFGLSRRV